MVDWKMIYDLPTMDLYLRTTIVLFTGLIAVIAIASIAIVLTWMLHRATNGFKKINSDYIGLYGTGLVATFLGVWYISPLIMTIVGHIILTL